ncbi:MAG: hypothetical protein KC800_05445 [Candidatus Eremiobacteraeota bacterium]|nr:hypothetical protein [Candidatus Eremiobacteraeota bacterium]
MEERNGLPTMSIVTASFSSPELLDAHLRSIWNSSLRPDEMIVASSLDEDQAAALISKYPGVNWVFAPGRDVFALRSLGVRQAREDVVVMTEDHCLWEVESLAAYSRAYQERPLSIGGAIVNGRGESSFAWALYFVEYANYSPELLRTHKPPLCSANALFPNGLLQKAESVWKNGFYDNEVHDAVAGQTWDVAPEAVVSSKLSFSLREAMIHMNAGGRRFGGYRWIHSSLPKRVALKFGAWLIPLVMWFRLLVKVGQTGSQFWSATPYIVLLYSAWALGELQAYWGPKEEVDSAFKS